MRLLRSSFLREFLKKKDKGVNFFVLKKDFLVKGKSLFKKRRNKFNLRKKFGRKFSGGRLLKSGIQEFNVSKRKFSTFYGRGRKSSAARFSGFKKKKNFSLFMRKIRRKKVRRASSMVLWHEKKGIVFSLLQRVLLLKRLNNYFRLRFFLPRFFFKFLRKPLFLYKFGFV